jgi:hypothetical protein
MKPAISNDSLIKDYLGYDKNSGFVFWKKPRGNISPKKLRELLKSKYV